jgi:Class III cytochrome C family
VPQWVQIAGVVIGGPVALIVAWQLWKHRREIRAWFVARSLRFKIALFGAAAVAGLIAGGTGLVGYNYLMHANDFCQSCHIMDTAWNRFQVSAHKNISCHACHRQPLYVSSVEMYYWVTERLMAVPAHDKVPNKVCEECHRRADTDSARTNIMLTAGHALHLQSDSGSLKNVKCVTCHGRDFHKFVPNNATCQQSGCHATQRVVLGAMSTNGFFHCATCHDFKNRVPAGTSPKDAAKALAPHALECSKCHAMSTKIAGFDLAADPHKGSCGSCHNPHKQTEPKDAYKTCAGCHVKADTLTSFHRGLGPHKLDQCGSCHQAHSWKVKGTDCLACHKNIFQDKPAKQIGAGSTGAQQQEKQQEEPEEQGPSAAASEPAIVEREIAPAPDTAFLHSRHKSVACTDCHSTSGTHGGLKVTAPAGCLACHHGAAQKTSCVTCHSNGPPAPYPVPVEFHVSARKSPVAITRPISFSHSRHGSLECARCHGADTKRSVAPATCDGCHADHHTAARDCASCHPTARAGHDRAVHDGCASCHTDARVAALTASRSLCLACHQEQREHHKDGDCGTCHAVALHPGAKAGRPL